MPPEVANAFQGVDLILHAGDIYDLSVLDELEQIAPVTAASGDDDYGATLKDPRVKWKQEIEVGGLSLVLVHESPYYYVLTPPEQRSPQLSNTMNADIVVYGHTHFPKILRHNGILLINPGSPTYLSYRRGLGTVAILTIDSGEPRAEILQL